MPHCAQHRSSMLASSGGDDESLHLQSALMSTSLVVSDSPACSHSATTTKPLSPVDQAALYQELKNLVAEDAARRQEASRFSANEDLGGDSGGEDSSAPLSPYGGKTREQASTMVSGRLGFQRYEQIGALKQIANDPARPANVRGLARHELAAIDGGASVHPAYTKVMAALELAEPSDGSGRSSPDDLETLAAEALARARQERARGGDESAAAGRPTPQTRRSLRSFILTWTDLDGWSAHYDAEEVGVKLADKDWETFERVLRETNAFAEVARAARQRDERSASA
jgi:ParB family chromosome partitioning protein